MRSIDSPVPHAATSWLSPGEEAVFALAYNSGLILILKWNPGHFSTLELKQDSSMPRFLSGLATAFRRNNEINVPMSLTIHTFGNELYLFALYREGNIRMWSCSKGQCIAYTDIMENQQEACQGAQGHILRKCVESEDELYLGTFMKFSHGCEFCVFKPVHEAGIFKFVKLCTLLAPDVSVSQ